MSKAGLTYLSMIRNLVAALVQFKLRFNLLRLSGGRSLFLIEQNNLLKLKYVFLGKLYFRRKLQSPCSCLYYVVKFEALAFEGEFAKHSVIDFWIIYYTRLNIHLLLYNFNKTVSLCH